MWNLARKKNNRVYICSSTCDESQCSEHAGGHGRHKERPIHKRCHYADKIQSILLSKFKCSLLCQSLGNKIHLQITKKNKNKWFGMQLDNRDREVEWSRSTCATQIIPILSSWWPCRTPHHSSSSRRKRSSDAPPRSSPLRTTWTPPASPCQPWRRTSARSASRRPSAWSSRSACNYTVLKFFLKLISFFMLYKSSWNLKFHENYHTVQLRDELIDLKTQ